MKQSTMIGILLVFLMLLLVLAAAVYFLSDQNQDQAEQLGSLAANQAAAQATATHLSSLVVQEAAEGQVIAQTAAAGSQAPLVADQPPVVSVTSLENQEPLAPGEPAHILIGIQASPGAAAVRLMVNGQLLTTTIATIADEQAVLTLVIPWTASEEGSYDFRATVTDANGLASQPATLIITAAYDSPEARDAIRQEQLAAGVQATRFPESAAAAFPAAVLPRLDSALHRLMLTGSTSVSTQDLERESLVLQAFDLPPDQADLTAYADFLSQPLLGYYDPDGLEMVVFAATGPAGPFTYWLNLHDLTHTYQAERFGLDQLDFGGMGADQRAAVRAMVEGEAAFMQYLSLQGELFTTEEEAEIASELNGIAADPLAPLANLPAMLSADFTFAYTAGLPFIQSLYAQGGSAALDPSLERSPLSTEQILHPASYLNNEAPQEIALAPLGDILDDGWQLLVDEALGEWRLQHYLAQQLPVEQAQEASEGWGGDRYLVYQHGSTGALILVLRLAWDTPSDGAQFGRLYSDYLARRFGKAGFSPDEGGLCWLDSDAICLYSLADQHLIVRSPDLTIAGQIAALQRGQ